LGERIDRLRVGDEAQAAGFWQEFLELAGLLELADAEDNLLGVPMGTNLGGDLLGILVVRLLQVEHQVDLPLADFEHLAQRWDALAGIALVEPATGIELA